MARKPPLRVYSAQGLSGHIVQSAMSEVTIYKGRGKEMKEIGKEPSPTYSFVDEYNREYSLHHGDIEILINTHVMLHSYDGTFLEGKGLKGCLINGIGELDVQLEDKGKKHRYADPRSCRYPKEGLKVEIVDTDAFVWEYENGRYTIDYSPTTLGFSEMVHNRFECTIEWSDEDECYIARSCISPFLKAHGPSKDEAAKEFSYMIQHALDTRRRRS